MSIKPGLTALLVFLALNLFAQKKSNDPLVIAYYAGNATEAEKYEINKLTHIIYSFCHLSGNKLKVDDAGDSLTIKSLVALKKVNPKLRVLLSLGGWGGCKPCSEVFESAENRSVFAQSVKELCEYFGTDGIDLDWEYPAIPGYPGHRYVPADKENFTSLIKELRKTLGKKYDISFAAGGFSKFLEGAVDWKAIMPVVSFVNLMTYDLINGYDTVTGHHTALYSTTSQLESTDHAVRYLLGLGIPASKLVIGAAFYARVWENVPAENNGLRQTGKFKRGVPYKMIDSVLSAREGFNEYWDSTAQAPYRYSANSKLFATYDDKRSIEAKTNYVLKNHLGGIMFWHLPEDSYRDGLLDAIDRTIRKNKK